MRREKSIDGEMADQFGFVLIPRGKGFLNKKGLQSCPTTSAGFEINFDSRTMSLEFPLRSCSLPENRK